MQMRLFSCLLTGLLSCAPFAMDAQDTTVDLIDKVYGTTPERPDGYSFTHAIHYSVVRLVEQENGDRKKAIEETMDLYYTPGGEAYGRVMTSEEATVSHIGDVRLGMRYSLTRLGELNLGNEAELSSAMMDTLIMSRVSGDREIDGRMSAHYWYENGSIIDELWADSQASESEVAISRLWPRFEPGFRSLATGNYVGLATRWVAVDTQFSREPRIVLEFKGAEELPEPLKISFEGYTFPVSAGEMMRKRLEAERQ